MRKKALVVSVDRRGRSDSILSSATSCASDVYQTLTRRFGYDASLLVNPSASDFMSDFSDLVEDLDDDSQFVFYFAGRSDVDDPKGCERLLFRERNGDATDSIAFDALYSLLRRGRALFCLDVCPSRFDLAPAARLFGTPDGLAVLRSSDEQNRNDVGALGKALIGGVPDAGTPQVLKLDPALAEVVTPRLDKGERLDWGGTPIVLVPSERATAQSMTTRLAITVGGEDYYFRWIPPGEFDMGSPVSDPDHRPDEALHRVVLTRGFWLMETPATQLLYARIMGERPWKLGEPLPDSKVNPAMIDRYDHPAGNVSYEKATQFCERLTKLLPKSLKATLPTEAQWEYACRAGTTTTYNWGSKWDFDMADAWSGVGDARSAPVKRHAPNAWGLYDMHGGVWEWTTDVYRRRYEFEEGVPTIDPCRTADGAGRVARGGSCSDAPARCRSAFRRQEADGVKLETVGFRVLLTETDDKR